MSEFDASQIPKELFLEMVIDKKKTSWDIALEWATLKLLYNTLTQKEYCEAAGINVKTLAAAVTKHSAEVSRYLLKGANRDG